MRIRWALFKATILIAVVLDGTIPLLCAQDPEITAQIVEGRPASLAGIVVEATEVSRNYKREFIASGDVFRLLLQRGQYRIAFRGLPLDYAVATVNYGNENLLRGKLDFSSGTASEPILIKLIKVQPDSITGHRVSGAIRGLPAVSGSIKVMLMGIDAGGSAIETSVRPDSTFEFAKVPPGRYSARVWPADGSVPASLTVADNDLKGIELVVNAANPFPEFPGGTECLVFSCTAEGEVNLRGVITQPVVVISPRSKEAYFRMDVAAADGSVKHWAVLFFDQPGFPRLPMAERFEPGVMVSLSVVRAKDGSDRGLTVIDMEPGTIPGIHLQQ